MKQDIINYIQNEKYYSELELDRIFHDPTLSRKDKVSKISEELGNIALTGSKLQFLNIYMPDTTSEPPEAPAQTQEPEVDVVDDDTREEDVKAK